MGQKINPIGLRLGINRGWDSTWYAKKKDFGKYLIEDFKMREYIKKNIVNSGVSEIIKIPNESNFHFKGKYIVSSLSGSLRGPDEYSGLHLYIFEIKDGLYKFSERIFVNDRIRDLKYNPNDDSIYLIMENSQKIAVLKTK